jgi:hypothetical protein
MDCITETVPDTVEDLGFNVDEYGWKVSLQHKRLLSFLALIRMSS